MTTDSFFLHARRLSAALLASAVIALGPASTTVRAGESELPPPTIQSLRFEGDDLYIMFLDNADGELRYRVDFWLRDYPDVQWQSEVPGLAGSDRLLMRIVENVRHDQPICARMFTAEESDLGGRILNSSASAIWYSDGSNAVCIDPAKKPTDLVVANVRGPEVIKVTPARAILLQLRNDGADSVDNVTVNIQTTGVVKLADDQAIVKPGWDALGFNCTRRTPSGTANGLLRCTTGTLRQGQDVDPAVIISMPDPGFGSVYVSVGQSGPEQSEEDKSDNGLSLNIQVTR